MITCALLCPVCSTYSSSSLHPSSGAAARGKGGGARGKGQGGVSPEVFDHGYVQALRSTELRVSTPHRGAMRQRPS
jgi:hypothetical protein